MGYQNPPIAFTFHVLARKKMQNKRIQIGFFCRLTNMVANVARDWVRAIQIFRANSEKSNWLATITDHITNQSHSCFSCSRQKNRV
jgi:uncharacterized protein (DUF2384 family)